MLYQEGELLISQSSKYTNCKVEQVFFDKVGGIKYLLSDVFGSFHELDGEELDYCFSVCEDASVE